MTNGAPDPILKSKAGNPLKLFIDVDWSGDAAAKLMSASFRMNDFGPLLRAIGRKIVLSTRKNILEQRSPGGTGFRPLKKKRGKGHNPGSKTLFDSGALYESIDYNVIGNEAVEIGFPHSTFYGKFHQSGTRHIPARPFLGIRPDDLPTEQELLAAHVAAAFDESKRVA